MSTLSAQILVLITHPKLSGFFGESGDSRYVLGIIQWPWNVLLYLTIRVVQNVVVAWKKKRESQNGSKSPKFRQHKNFKG